MTGEQWILYYSLYHSLWSAGRDWNWLTEHWSVCSLVNSQYFIILILVSPLILCASGAVFVWSLAGRLSLQTNHLLQQFRVRVQYSFLPSLSQTKIPTPLCPSVSVTALPKTGPHTHTLATVVEPPQQYHCKSVFVFCQCIQYSVSISICQCQYQSTSTDCYYSFTGPMPHGWPDWLKWSDSQAHWQTEWAVVSQFLAVQMSKLKNDKVFIYHRLGHTDWVVVCQFQTAGCPQSTLKE